MNLLQIALLALYLTGVVLFVEINFKPDKHLSKKDMKWYVLGYMIVAVIWPILYVIIFVKLLFTKSE